MRYARIRPSTMQLIRLEKPLIEVDYGAKVEDVYLQEN